MPDIEYHPHLQTSGGGPGDGSDANYVHTQAIPSALWSITHNLHKFSSVTVVDSAKSVVIGDIQYLSPDSVEISFSASFAGQAFFN